MIIPSRKRALGLVVNEAMASNVLLSPSSGTGCSKDLVIEDYNGYTYETGDIYALSKIISKLIINKNKLETFKKNSLELISNIVLKQLVQIWVARSVTLIKYWFLE